MNQKKTAAYAVSLVLAILVTLGILKPDIADKVLSMISQGDQAGDVFPSAPSNGHNSGTDDNRDDSLEINRQAVEVGDVLDGETLEVVINNEKEVMKLIGVNAPDLDDARATPACQAKLSKEHLESRLRGKNVFIANDPQLQKYDRDGYQLVYVYTGKVNTDNLVNLDMITEGYASAREYDVKHSYELLFREKWSIARMMKLGLWADGVC